MISLIRNVRHFSHSQNLACKPGRPTPIIPEVHEGGYKIWRNLSLVSLLLVSGLSFYNFVLHKHKIKRQKFIPYEHLRIRRKRFAWGNGQRSLFHNPQLNALPDGYEIDDTVNDYEEEEDE